MSFIERKVILIDKIWLKQKIKVIVSQKGGTILSSTFEYYEGAHLKCFVEDFQKEVRAIYYTDISKKKNLHNIALDNSYDLIHCTEVFL